LLLIVHVARLFKGWVDLYARVTHQQATHQQAGGRMTLPALSTVQATRDIPYGRTTAIPTGSTGTIVNHQTGWAATTYTVEFTQGPGMNLTLVGLSESDVRAR
jgi:hypothetical protein